MEDKSISGVEAIRQLIEAQKNWQVFRAKKENDKNTIYVGDTSLTEDELKNIKDGDSFLKKEIVSELPAIEDAKENIIYMVDTLTLEEVIRQAQASGERLTLTTSAYDLDESGNWVYDDIWQGPYYGYIEVNPWRQSDGVFVMFNNTANSQFDNKIFITNGLHGKVLYDIKPVHTFTNEYGGIIGAVFKISDDISGTHLYITTSSTNPDYEYFNYYYLPNDSILHRDNYKEYIFINGEFNKIGISSDDLNNYVTKDTLDEVVGDIESALDVILAIQEGLINGGSGEEEELITFTYTDIDGNTFTLNAANGWTWGEWCESEYNTIGAFVNSEQGNSIYVGVTQIQRYWYEDGEEYPITQDCYDTTPIIANATYRMW